MGGRHPPRAPQRCLRARAILIRPASERPSIVLALTLASVYHWFLSGGLLGGGGVTGGSGGGCWRGFIELQLKGLFQRDSVDQRKECLYCDWEMGRAGGKNGRPAERAVCLSGAPQMDPVSPEPIRAENPQAASADNLRSPEKSLNGPRRGQRRVSRGAWTRFSY